MMRRVVRLKIRREPWRFTVIRRAKQKANDRLMRSLREDFDNMMLMPPPPPERAN